MMEFNFLSERGAITRESSGRYAIDYAKMPEAIAAVTKELLEIEATGDRARAEAWFGRYEKMPAELRDRKSTRLNSSHSQISYAVFCLKKKKRVAGNFIQAYCDP